MDKPKRVLIVGMDPGAPEGDRTVMYAFRDSFPVEITHCWIDEAALFTDKDFECATVDLQKAERWYAGPISATFSMEISPEEHKKLSEMFGPSPQIDYGSMMDAALADAVPSVVAAKALHADERDWHAGNHRPVRSKKAKGQKWRR